MGDHPRERFHLIEVEITKCADLARKISLALQAALENHILYDGVSITANTIERPADMAQALLVDLEKALRVLEGRK